MSWRAEVVRGTLAADAPMTAITLRLEAYDRDARAAVAAAQTLADARQHAEVEPVHLLHALFDRAALAKELARRAGVDPSDVVLEAEVELRCLAATTGQNAFLSKRTLELLTRAEGEAARAAGEPIAVRHLLIAAGQETAGGAGRVLSACALPGPVVRALLADPASARSSGAGVAPSGPEFVPAPWHAASTSGLPSGAPPGPPAAARGDSGAPPRHGAFLLVVALASFLLGGVAIYLAQTREPEPARPAVTTRVVPTATVVVAMRELARLETTEFHMERVVDLRDEQAQLFGLVRADDEILLVASGQVIAGVDLSSLSDDAVTVSADGREVVLVLPEPTVLVARLDNERTYVHRRETDLLARRAGDLETRARQEAERSIRTAAIEAGILDAARRGAERAVTPLVRGLGFERVTVRFAERAP